LNMIYAIWAMIILSIIAAWDSYAKWRKFNKRYFLTNLVFMIILFFIGLTALIHHVAQT